MADDGNKHRPGRSGMTARLVALALGSGLWVWAGVGQHVLLSKCYESRHSIDRQPEVGGGVVGLAITVVVWPMFTLANVMDPPECLPVPLGSPTGVGILDTR